MKRKFSKMVGVAVTLAMLSSLIIAPMAGAVSSPTVVLSNAVISQGSNYTLTFDVVAAVPNNGIITVGFPIGTTVAALVTGNVTLQATAGFGTLIAELPFATGNMAVTAGSTTVGPSVALTVTTADFTASCIGEGATVRIKFKNTVVTNPSAVADYTLTVKTNQTGDTVAVASQAYTLYPPSVLPLPGIVELYNASGILMSSYSGIGNRLRLSVPPVTGSPSR